MPSSTTAAEDEPPQFTDLDDKKHRYLLSKKDQKAHHTSVDDSVKRFKYLLGLTDLFRHFIDLRAKDDPKFRSILKEVDRSTAAGSKRGKGRSTNRRRKTEREEDAELLNDEEEEPHTTVFTESPSYVHGKLREYQVQGLNWLISLHENGISGILADEMGLGKTLQTISFLGYLRYVQEIEGPHIVIVPKSTLDNWGREFAKWTPNVRTLILQGDKESRAQLIQDRLLSCDFDICISSYEMVIKEKATLRKFAWQYIIVDEAHRIKNEDSMLSQIIRLFHSNNRLLITGTPLQNNMHELWALLNFILPDVFSDSQVFDQWFENSSDQDTVVQQLHKVLRPFLLRRVKSDVEKSLLPKKEINIYTGMTEMQVKWYRRLLEKDIDAVNGAVGKREGKTRLLNIVMQLRKCCNHPYLFEGAEPGPPFTTDEHLVDNAGKMIILDKLLKHVKEQGSRVLIFSQMSRMLDILEDYCTFREWEYSRIDGSTNHEDRVAAIDEYNKPDSDKFVFLLTTRAGGLGINLTTADVVILYDSDWNPQADLQAMDRAHRIGQTKQVMVFRFVTEKAIEEKVLERAAQKLRLDQLVIQQGRANQNAAKNATTSKDELLQMIQHGAQEVFESKNGGTMSETNIEDILRKGEERTAKLNAKYAQLGIDDLQKFTSDSSAYEWNGENFKKTAGNNGIGWINPSKRERKEQTYSIDGYYKGIMNINKPNSGPRTHRAPRQVHMLDFQFFNPRLRDLQEKEMNYYRKTVNQKVSINDIDDSDLDDDETKEQRRKKENQIIADAEPLTEEEEAEKQELAKSGFNDWSKRDFTSFIHHVAKYGRDNFAAIAREYHDKTPEDIERYSVVFWQRYKEIDGYDRYLAQIEAGEEKNKKLIRQQRQLRQKIEAYRAPMSEMTITYPVSNAKKTYTEEEDRFLLLQVNELGLDTPNLYEKIQERIKRSPLFRFDWFFLSRTPIELSRRVSTLLLAITREFDGPTALKRKSGPRKAVHNDGDSSVADTPVSNAMSPDVSYDDDYDENNSAGNTPGPASKKQKKIRTDVVKEMELGKA